MQVSDLRSNNSGQPFSSNKCIQAPNKTSNQSSFFQALAEIISDEEPSEFVLGGDFQCRLATFIRLLGREHHSERIS